MNNAIGISEISMLNDLIQLNTISHNIANANTDGFQRELAVATGLGVGTPEEAASLGVPFFGMDRTQLIPQLENIHDRSAGVLKRTGNPLDIAIEGEGFFELVGPQGMRYTRHGSFSLDDRGALVAQDGSIVNGINGEIRLNSADPLIDKEGQIWENNEVVGQLKIVRFINPGALVEDGGGLFEIGNAVPAPEEAKSNLRQGFIETSNVQVMEEMVKLIETMRHFEASQKIISSYDEAVNDAIRTIGEF